MWVFPACAQLSNWIKPEAALPLPQLKIARVWHDRISKYNSYYCESTGKGTKKRTKIRIHLFFIYFFWFPHLFFKPSCWSASPLTRTRFLISTLTCLWHVAWGFLLWWSVLRLSFVSLHDIYLSCFRAFPFLTEGCNVPVKEHVSPDYLYFICFISSLHFILLHFINPACLHQSDWKWKQTITYCCFYFKHTATLWGWSTNSNMHVCRTRCSAILISLLLYKHFSDEFKVDLFCSFSYLHTDKSMKTPGIAVWLMLHVPGPFRPSQSINASGCFY